MVAVAKPDAGLLTGCMLMACCHCKTGFGLQKERAQPSLPADTAAGVIKALQIIYIFTEHIEYIYFVCL